MTPEVVQEDYQETELGFLPRDWEVKKISCIADVKYGKSKPTDSGKVPVVGSSGTYSYTSKALVDYPTIVIGRKGNAGKTWLCLEPCYPSDTTFYLVWKEKVNPMYVFSFLSLHPLSGEHAKTTVPSLQKPDLENLLIPLPSIKEQEQISVVLSKIQKAKESTEIVLQSLKELKKSLMKHLFTYGAVSLKEAANIKLKETEIGEMPEGWNVVSIGNIARFQGGFAFKSGDYTHSGVRLFRISNVSFGKVLWHEIAYLPENFLQEYGDFALRRGDLVMAMTRPIVSGGIKITKIGSNDAPCLLNQRVGRFLVDPSKIETDFLFHVLFDKVFREAINEGAIGSEQPNISAKQIERIRILLPPLAEPIKPKLCKLQ